MAKTLYEYYSGKGQSLPSVSARSATAKKAGINNYTGSASQNAQLLSYLSGSGSSISSPKTAVQSPLASATSVDTGKSSLPANYGGKLQDMFGDDPNAQAKGAQYLEDKGVYDNSKSINNFRERQADETVTEYAQRLRNEPLYLAGYDNPATRPRTLTASEVRGLGKDLGLEGTGFDFGKLSGLTKADAQRILKMKGDELRGQTSAMTSFALNSDYFNPLSSSKKLFDAFNVGLKSATSPWNTDKDKAENKNRLIEDTSLQLSQLFDSPATFDSMYSGNSEFKKLMDSYSKQGGSIDAVRNKIVGSQPENASIEGNPLSQDSSLLKTPALPRVETDNEMLKDYAQGTNDQIEQLAGVPEQMRQFYFGDTGYFTKIRQDAEANLASLEESYKTIEKNTEADYKANVQRAELEAEKQFAEIEEARVDSKNYMTGMLAKLGALTTTGEAPASLARLETKYKAMATNVKASLASAKSTLAGQKASAIAQLQQQKLASIQQIRSDVTKSSYEVQRELMNLEIGTKEKIGNIIQDFNKESYTLDKEALQEAQKLKLEYDKMYYKTASGGATVGGVYGANGSPISQRAQDIINAINAGSGTLESLVQGTSKEANALRAEVLRGMSSTGGYSQPKIDQMTSLRDLAKELETADVSEAVGASWSKAMPWDSQLMSKGLQPKRASQLAKINNLKAQLTGENLGLLKGAMSDKDIQFLEQMANRINLDADETTFAEEMKRIREFMDKKLSYAGQTQNQNQGGASSASSASSSLDSVMKPTEPEKKSIGGFLGNVGKSALNFGQGLATAVMNPIDTVKTVGSLALGAGDNILEAGGLSSGNNRFNKMADMVGNEYKERYGGWDNIKNTAYNDPVGVLADLSTVLSGGAGAVTKVGKVAQIGSQASKLAGVGKVAQTAGNILNKTARITDPLQIALKGAGKASSLAVKKGATPLNLGFNTIGLTTGRGGETFRQIFESAKAGRKGAVDAMRGGLDDNKIIASLDKADSTLRQMARDEYKKLGLDDMSKSLDISPITKELDTQLNNFRIGKNADGTLDFRDSKIRFDKNSQTRIQTIYDEMKDYGLRAGADNPAGVDTLKQSLGTLFDDSSDVKAFVQAVKGKTRDVLSNVDGYDDYSKNYGEIMDLLGEMKRELSSRNKNPSQTWRKLVNTFKQKNTESRQAIVRKLQEGGISDIADEIAGFTAKDIVPNDIIRGGAGFYSLGAGVNPLILPTLSPRIMGEVVNFIGKNTGRAKRFSDWAKKTSNNGVDKIPASQVIKYIGGQVYNKNKATRSSTLQQRLEEAQDDED